MTSLTPAQQLALSRPRKRASRNGVRKEGPFRCACREMRETVGLSLDAVAEAVGLSKTAIFQIEHGGDLVLSNAMRLADFYGVTVEMLWEKRT